MAKGAAGGARWGAPAEPRTPPAEALADALACWDVFEVEVAASHRPAPLGPAVTAAKRAALRALGPLRRRLLDAQRAFNRSLVAELARLSGAPSPATDGAPAAWSGPPHRPLAETFAPPLAAQARWNRAAWCLLESARGGTPLAAAEVHRLLAELASLASLPAKASLGRAHRVAWPMWVELLRRQERFNRSAAQALGALHGLPRRADDGRGWYPEALAADEAARAAEVAAKARALPTPPLLSVVMPTWRAQPRWLEAAVASVRAQSYPRWELLMVDDGSGAEAQPLLDALAAKDSRIHLKRRPGRGGIAAATNDALELARGDFVAFLDHDDALAPSALAEVALHLAEHPETDVLYSDEDHLDPEGRRRAPFFKPELDLELLRSVNYVCHFLVARRSLVDAVGRLRPGFDGAQDYDLALRLVERARRVGHVPRVLYHWREAAGSTAATPEAKPETTERGRRALREHLQRAGEAAEVEAPAPNSYRVRYPLPVGTRIEVIRGDEAEWARAWRARPADVYVFADSDVKQPGAEALEELARQALRQDVGMVAPKVLHADGTLQSAALLGEDARLPRSPWADLADLDEWTCAGLARWSRTVAAVPQCCFAVRREVLEALGGVPAAAAAEPAPALGRRSVFAPRATITRHDASTEGSAADGTLKP